MSTKFKFNNGNMSLVCSSCGIILKTGHDLTEEEWKCLSGELDLGDKYCSDCEGNVKSDNKKDDDITSNLKHIKNILPHIKNDENFQLNLLNSLMKKIKK
jgi:hypothetical protein